jgi:hypothetical protein
MTKVLFDLALVDLMNFDVGEGGVVVEPGAKMR